MATRAQISPARVIGRLVCTLRHRLPFPLPCVHAIIIIIIIIIPITSLYRCLAKKNQKSGHRTQSVAECIDSTKY